MFVYAGSSTGIVNVVVHSIVDPGNVSDEAVGTAVGMAEFNFDGFSDIFWSAPGVSGGVNLDAAGQVKARIGEW